MKIIKEQVEDTKSTKTIQSRSLLCQRAFFKEVSFPLRRDVMKVVIMTSRCVLFFDISESTFMERRRRGRGRSLCRGQLLDWKINQATEQLMSCVFCFISPSSYERKVKSNRVERKLDESFNLFHLLHQA